MQLLTADSIGQNTTASLNEMNHFAVRNKTRLLGGRLPTESLGWFDSVVGWMDGWLPKQIKNTLQHGISLGHYLHEPVFSLNQETASSATSGQWHREKGGGGGEGRKEKLEQCGRWWLTSQRHQPQRTTELDSATDPRGLPPPPSSGYSAAGLGQRARSADRP